ncbi:MAG TPA: TIGR03435 family protein [Bryobacteraceae bacterium]|nr:TIGR03435 family protein [Bryobacteraceae bacterium]
MFRAYVFLCILAMPSSAQSTFDFASIHPTPPELTLRSIQIPPDGSTLTIRGLTLKEFVQLAWGDVPVGTGLHASLVATEGGWIERDRFDVSAKTETGSPSREQRKRMLQALLVERFQLQLRREPRMIPVYDLERGGSQLKLKSRSPGDGGAPFSLPFAPFHIPGRNVSMAQLADLLQTLIPLTDPERDDLPVVNRTGLLGTFDFDLQWSGDPPNLFPAIREQLGLTLVPRRAAVQILVIDHAERPGEN